MRRGEQQTDDPARGFANPVHLRQVQAVEHRQDLPPDRLGSVAISARRLIREAAAEQVGAVDPVGFRDCRHPSVAECRVAGKTHASSAPASNRPTATGNRRGCNGRWRLPPGQCEALRNSFENPTQIIKLLRDRIWRVEYPAGASWHADAMRLSTIR